MSTIHGWEIDEETAEIIRNSGYESDDIQKSGHLDWIDEWQSRHGIELNSYAKMELFLIALSITK